MSHAGVSDGGCVLLAATLALRASNQLSSGPPLVQLLLRGNRIGAEGGKALADALADGAAPLLKRCALGSNLLEGSAGEALAYALQSTPRLKELRLEHNLLPDSALLVLAEVLQQREPTVALPLLKRLDISHNVATPAGELALMHACEERRAGSSMHARLQLCGSIRAAWLPSAQRTTSARARGPAGWLYVA
eukprot:CAMPEP_0181182440 /NCGR_PEP_ID=MMETSP1096-20121128/7892_1 /TAXON_ID=156174 ORGANISM="Chrysochromulina ericina, Strain CCMP281" /NCGR_SAMPLE_ID=MMETSP1096 /ASSEMBLY_ACC=CAM_ASM_000453 /LENGTH=191 /DNA_ID=CAMNT_0023271051 /DNA_START=170 /DNA_END=745 /DNA_ORIENTATION=-